MKHNHAKAVRIVMNVSQVLLLVLMLVLLFFSLGFRRDSPTAENVTHLNQVQVSVDGAAFAPITLPHTFQNLAPNTPVIIRTTVTPTMDDGVFIESQYARADVFFDDQLVFSFGKPENYPSYMITPATEIHVIETNGTGEPMELRIVYASPATDASFSVQPPMVGTSKELILERFLRYGASWALALVQVIGGAALLMISLGIVFIDRKGILFAWLGLFSLSTGLWFFGSNSFSVTIFPVSAWLYLVSFSGLYLFLLPLLHFLEIAADFSDPRPIRLFEGLLIGANLAVILLQVLRIVPLHQSENVFRILMPASLVVLVALLLAEWVRTKNANAGRFVLPTLVLSLSAILEFYFHVGLPDGAPAFFPIFQLGVLLFLLLLGLLASIIVKDSVTLKKREQKLAYEQSILQLQTAEQREHRLLLAQTEAELSRQRHDLHHHLTAIQELARDNPELQAYLSALMEQIPTARARFCENNIVNTVVSHFASQCSQGEIRFSVSLVVPETDRQELDVDLCAIFANLLENAVEACGRMEDGDRFIHLKSTFRNNILTITMENSFNGEVHQVEGRFQSSKRNAYGVGLASVQSIAEAAHGGTDFHAEEMIFYSSVYLHLGNIKA